MTYNDYGSVRRSRSKYSGPTPEELVIEKARFTNRGGLTTKLPPEPTPIITLVQPKGIMNAYQYEDLGFIVMNYDEVFG